MMTEAQKVWLRLLEKLAAADDKEFRKPAMRTIKGNGS
jgi:hypothetical protein